MHDGKLNFPNFLSDMEICRFLIVSDTHTHSNTRITPSTMDRFVLLPSNYYGKIKALSRQATLLPSTSFHSCKTVSGIANCLIRLQLSPANVYDCVSYEKRSIDDCDTYTAKGRYLFVYTIYT